MATRYVWEKYNLQTSGSEAHGMVNRTEETVYSINNKAIAATSSLYWAVYKTRTVLQNGKHQLSNLVSYGTCTATNGSFAGRSFKYSYETYIVFDTSTLASKSTITPSVYYLNATTYRIEYDSEDPNWLSVTTLSANDKYWGIAQEGFDSQKYTIATTYSCGTTLYGYTTSSSSSAYPTNNYSGSYWYIYRGSDCIDPTAVGYSTTEPKGGEVITINVTKCANTYGGTISYRYEYSVDGGNAWTVLGTTTATSYSFTIPKGTGQFMARVLASDNMGFTSTDYVTGANLTVKNTSVYAGVGGIAKDVEAVACVGGVVKTNVSMYQGVNGTVKQS